MSDLDTPRATAERAEHTRLRLVPTLLLGLIATLTAVVIAFLAAKGLSWTVANDSAAAQAKDHSGRLVSTPTARTKVAAPGFFLAIPYGYVRVIRDSTGNAGAAIDADVCFASRGVAEPFDYPVARNYWQAELDNGSLILPVLGPASSGEFPAVQVLRDGKCAAGRIAFKVPKSRAVVSYHYADSLGTSAEFRTQWFNDH